MKKILILLFLSTLAVMANAQTARKTTPAPAKTSTTPKQSLTSKLVGTWVTEMDSDELVEGSIIITFKSNGQAVTVLKGTSVELTDDNEVMEITVAYTMDALWALAGTTLTIENDYEKGVGKIEHITIDGQDYDELIPIIGDMSESFREGMGDELSTYLFKKLTFTGSDIFTVLDEDTELTFRRKTAK